MAAISCCELRSVRAALLRLGELNLPGLQSSEIPDYYLNVSPYLYFTQKCQIQLWMEHPGKGVALCPCVLWALPAEGPGEWYQCQVHPQHLWIPTLYLKVPGTPKFYSSKFTTGCKWPGRFCHCWCHYCTLHNPCLRAWFWPVSPGWDQAPCSQPFPASPDVPWLLPVQGSPAQGSHPKNTTWYHCWANSASLSHAKYL